MPQSRKILRIFFKNLDFHVFRDSCWRLVHGWKVQLRGVYRDFHGSSRDSLTGRSSNREKHLENFSKFLSLSVLVADFGDLHATRLSWEKRVFCANWAVFKTF